VTIFPGGEGEDAASGSGAELGQVGPQELHQ
jgi:hypothetical protein